jgi:hypothetical protein
MTSVATQKIVGDKSFWQNLKRVFPIWKSEFIFLFRKLKKFFKSFNLSQK